MKPSLTTLLILVAAVATASCAFNHPIPQGWQSPLTEPGDKCPDISGQYRQKSEAAGKSRPADLFTEWNGGFIDQRSPDPNWKGEHEVSVRQLKGGYITLLTPDPDWKNEHKILIKQDNEGHLEIVYMTMDGVMLSKRILKKENGDYACKDGWILTKVKFYNAPIPTTTIRSFAKTDGYLVEKVRWSTFSILGFPGYAEGTDWLRYAPTASPAGR